MHETTETCDYCHRGGDVLCYPGSGVFHEACLVLAETEAFGGAQVFSSNDSECIHGDEYLVEYPEGITCEMCFNGS